VDWLRRGIDPPVLKGLPSFFLGRFLRLLLSFSRHGTQTRPYQQLSFFESKAEMDFD
jgi:hypothetical protein